MIRLFALVLCLCSGPAAAATWTYTITGTIRAIDQDPAIIDGASYLNSFTISDPLAIDPGLACCDAGFTTYATASASATGSTRIDNRPNGALPIELANVDQVYYQVDNQQNDARDRTEIGAETLIGLDYGLLIDFYRGSPFSSATFGQIEALNSSAGDVVVFLVNRSLGRSATPYVLDNLSISTSPFAPVPLPAGLPLFASALAALFAITPIRRHLRHRCRPSGAACR